MKNRFIRQALTLLMALLLSLAPLGQAAFAQTENVKVMTSFYPLYIFAQNLLSEISGVTLQNLTHPSTGCLHDYQLLTSDLRNLSDADLLIVNGGGMESFLDTLSAQFPQLEVLDSSGGIQLIPETELVDDHDDPDDHDDDAHDHGEYNAHIWLDPKNAVQMCRNIALGLQTLLPHQAESIALNLEAYVERLEKLDKELRDQLKGLKRRDIVTFHEAFPYFAKAYDLHVVAVLALEPDEALSPAMLSELVKRVKEHGLPPLFTEPQYEDRAARAVAQETGAKIYELDPIVTGDGSPDAYEAGMRRNAQVLIEALGAQE